MHESTGNHQNQPCTVSTRIKFSIIVPFFSTPDADRTDMLEELLKSIPDRPDLEVIVIDDHSTPPCNPCTSYEKSTLNVILSEAGSKSAGTARNVGISKSSGDFVLFADSDDLFDANIMNKIFNDIKNIGDEQIDVILFNAHEFSATDKPDSTPLRSAVLKDIRSKNDVTLSANCHGPWGKIINRKFLSDHGILFETTRVANDTIFSTNVAISAASFKIDYGCGYLVRRNHGAGALTQIATEEALKQRYNVLQRSRRLLREAGRIDVAGSPHHFFVHNLNKNPKVVVKLFITGLLRGEDVLPSPLNLLGSIKRNLKR